MRNSTYSVAEVLELVKAKLHGEAAVPQETPEGTFIGLAQSDFPDAPIRQLGSIEFSKCV